MFAEHFSAVARSIRRHGVASRDVEDVAQDVFIAVHRNIQHLDGSRPIRAWLAAFVLHAVLNYRRLARHRIEPSDRIEPWSTGDPSTEVEARAARETVLAILDDMNPDRRDVFVLHDLEELTAPEVSKILAIPLGTVYSRLGAAREDFERAARRATAEPIRTRATEKQR